ncbi:hypothetical protein BDR06DRAFT_187112 [Suillus hirtellus]|nr:hypothetical protein BDR06DRAFT_187112 [Suillus hirtellus]
MLYNYRCFIIYVAESWMVVLVVAMLSVIIIIRLHAMYQRSRKILIFLIVTFLANNIFIGVVATMITMHTSGEELTAFGAYLCSINYAKDIVFLISLTWILCIVWEIFTLGLAVWVVVKHSRELQRHSAGGMIGDCFKVLMKSHVVYSASFAAAFCFQLIASLPQPSSTNLSYLEIQIYSGLVQILMVVQMSVLGPRLILGIREYHAKLVADSDAVTVISSIAFQERTHTSTISSSG